MLDFINIALRTIMCLAFIAFVVRPMLMSMIRREPNTLELEEMAQLAVSSAFKEQFSSFYAKRAAVALEAPKPDGASAPDATASAAPAVEPQAEPVPLTLASLSAKSFTRIRRTSCMGLLHAASEVRT